MAFSFAPAAVPLDLPKHSSVSSLVYGGNRGGMRNRIDQSVRVPVLHSPDAATSAHRPGRAAVRFDPCRSPSGQARLRCPLRHGATDIPTTHVRRVGRSIASSCRDA